MKRAYSYFKSPDDIKELGISVITERLFTEVQEIDPSEFLSQSLTAYQGVPVQSEKAKSEMVITPIINEVRLRNPKRMTYFSGYQFEVDKKRGLTGFCDFIISRKYNAAFIESPVLALVEAKHNQDLLDATPQCIAEMYAAQIFNERNGEAVSCIYGTVTNGYEWLFLKLEGSTAKIDIDRYGLNKNLPELLGVWQCVINSE